MSNTATRLITLIMLLQRRPNQKASDLSEELGVSVRTLHRYIAMLDEMGSTGLLGARTAWRLLVGARLQDAAQTDGGKEKCPKWISRKS